MTEKEARYTIDPEGKVMVFPRRQQFFVGPDPVVYGDKESMYERASTVVPFIPTK
mgnify:CR=1 FL=1